MDAKVLERLIAKATKLGPMPNACMLLTHLSDKPFLDDFKAGDEPCWREVLIVLLHVNPHITLEAVLQELHSTLLEADQ